MAITYATITGNFTVPDNVDIGLRATIEAWPLTENATLTWTAENVTTIGPVTAVTDAEGDFSMDIPLGADQDTGPASLFWRFIYRPLDRIPGLDSSIDMGIKEITASAAFATIPDPATTVVDADLYASITSLVASAVAVGTTNDTVIAGRANDDTSLTYAAIQGILKRIDVTDPAYAGGADPTGIVDSKAALQAVAAACTDGTEVFFPDGTYKVSTLADNTALMTFTNLKGVTVNAAGAVISNPTSYTADTITPHFKVDGCKDFRLILREYVGFTLPDPTQYLGYRGATLVWAVNGTDGLQVDARITNCRYGVVTGAYSSPPSGSCKNFDVRLRTSYCGYPLAAYLANGIKYDIDADHSHRPVYLAGCDNVKGEARWSNLHIAPVATLITDALVSGDDTTAQVAPPANPTTSRGCTNIDVVSVDKGSTVFHDSAGASQDVWCVGISLSRVDAVTFSNIRMRAYTKATDTVSTKVHGLTITSTAKAVWSRYTYNWTSSIVLDNIEWSGLIDKSATTVSNGTSGTFNIRTHDVGTPAQAATVRNLKIGGSVLKGTSLAASIVQVRGATGPVTFHQLNAPALYLLIEGNATAPAILEQTSVATLDTSTVATKVTLGRGASATGYLYVADTPIEAAGGAVVGAGVVTKMVEKRITGLSGASVTWTNAIPAGVRVRAVQTRVTTSLTGASGYQVGISGATTRYADKTGTASGTTTGIVDHLDDVLYRYAAATSLVLTAKTSNFTAGAIRVVITYDEFPTLSS